jgi:hypothetical protein
LKQSSGARWAIRPAAECLEVWFWLTIILFVSLLMGGVILSAFEPPLWGGPVRHLLLVQRNEPNSLGTMKDSRPRLSGPAAFGVYWSELQGRTAPQGGRRF